MIKNQKRLQPVHKATVLAKVRKTGKWTGNIAASNFNVNGMWGQGVEITIERAAMHDRPSKYVVTRDGSRTDLDKYLVIFANYNCNSELGRRIRFWEDTSAAQQSYIDVTFCCSQCSTGERETRAVEKRGLEAGTIVYLYCEQQEHENAITITPEML